MTEREPEGRSPVKLFFDDTKHEDASGYCEGMAHQLFFQRAYDWLDGVPAVDA